MRFFAWVLVAFAALLVPVGSALAQAPEAEARATFERGVAAYEAGAFEDALTAFQEAYRLTNDAQILYNVATVADRLRRDALALEAYEGYLAGYPAAPDRTNVEARIAALRSVIAAASVSAETVPEETTPEATAEPTLEAPEEPMVVDEASRAAAARQSEAGLVLTITGAVLAVGGAALLIASAVEIDAANRAETWAEFMGPSERAPLLSAVGWISMGLGAAMAALGVGWLVLGSSSQGSVALRVGPTHLALEGTF